MSDEQYPPEIELNFEKSSLSKLYNTGVTTRGVNPERWERVRRDIRFEDVVAELTGHSGASSIRCPFHGSDSRPSFWLYRGSNHGWCFGCSPRDQYYDHVRFVSKFLEINRVAALRWLEKKWELPPLADAPDEEEDEIDIQLKATDLQEPYILKASKQVQRFKDVELAEDYLKYYFLAAQQLKIADESRKQGEEEDRISCENIAAVTLARVLGKEELNRIFASKEVSK